jgi:small conductance mechanosensitive channel
VAGWARGSMLRAMEKAKVEATLARFFSTLTRYLILLLAVLAALGAFGIETTSFAAVLGAASLAIGLAFQGSLSHLASGVMLLIFRPFKVGDVITVAGQTGKIDEIELFTTRMITPDNPLIILPNGAVFGSTIENVTAFDTRRCDIPIGVSYDADIDATRKVLETLTAADAGVMKEPAPVVVLTGLGGSSVDWAVRAWVKASDYWAVRERLTRAMKYELEKAGIGIPYPQMDVHVDVVKGSLTKE